MGCGVVFSGIEGIRALLRISPLILRALFRFYHLAGGPKALNLGGSGAEPSIAIARAADSDNFRDCLQFVVWVGDGFRAIPAGIPCSSGNPSVRCVGMPLGKWRLIQRSMSSIRCLGSGWVSSHSGG